jgi:hypothetical protein
MTWGPWIIWTQGPRPVRADVIVELEMSFPMSGDIIGPMRADECDWNFPADPIARYRVQHPRALLQLIEMIETLPVRESEDA